MSAFDKPEWVTIHTPEELAHAENEQRDLIRVKRECIEYKKKLEANGLDSSTVYDTCIGILANGDCCPRVASEASDYCYECRITKAHEKNDAIVKAAAEVVEAISRQPFCAVCGVRWNSDTHAPCCVLRLEEAIK
jgi:hypothetical protein